MRILIINTDYPKFLQSLYASDLGLADAPYDAQMAVRNDSLFGVADFYSRNFRALGHEAIEVHVNNPWLQYAWAREQTIRTSAPRPPTPGGRDVLRNLARKLGGPVRNYVRQFASRAGAIGINDWEKKILAAQIESFNPDFILNQDTYYVRSEVLRRLKGPAKLIGQNAAVLPEGDAYAPYDLLVSSLPNYVEFFRKIGKRADLSRLAFEPSVLEKLGPQPNRDIALSFVGSLSPEHGGRIELLEHVAKHAPLRVWGNGIERLPRSSPLHALYQGEVWGRNMYNILRRSRVTLNKHINIAGNMANNMRLYEATGMGALLLTDNQLNLNEIFLPGQQVETYSSADDCLVQIEALLADEPNRAKIATAGQKQAIDEQNYFHRCGELVVLFEKL